LKCVKFVIWWSDFTIALSTCGTCQGSGKLCADSYANKRAAAAGKRKVPKPLHA
jgi:hypothetical protein